MVLGEEVVVVLGKEVREEEEAGDAIFYAQDCEEIWNSQPNSALAYAFAQFFFSAHHNKFSCMCAFEK